VDWSGEHGGLSEEQISLHKSQLRLLNDQQLQYCYEIYLRALALVEATAPSAAKLQYYVECWRELRHCQRRS
jgi:hypothetical protein